MTCVNKIYRIVSAGVLVGFTLLVCSGIGGCSFGGQSRPLNELMAGDKEGGTYVVSPGDALNVQVWGEPRVSGEMLVRDDGQLTVPLINDVPAAGKSLDQISVDISKRLEKYLTAPSVSVSIAQSAPTRYFLSGSFTKPGEYRSEGKITFLQAIATGGGFAPFANESNIVIIRKTATGEMRYKLDYNRVIDGKEPNPPLKNGDVIAVQ